MNSNFKTISSWVTEAPPSELENPKSLKASKLDTPLGQMLAIANEEALYLLEFVDCRNLERKMKRFKYTIEQGSTQPIHSIERELSLYFKGILKEFKTPTIVFGTPFQNRVWAELKKIPIGETRSYSNLATAIGKPSAFRAAAQANSSNQLALIIPCHRVINARGTLGGYAGGIARKKWLLDHEKRFNL